METIRESGSTLGGDRLRAMDPVEWTSKRSSIPPVSGEEDKGVVRFEDTDGFKGDDVLTAVDDSEDEVWSNGGNGEDLIFGELLGDGVGLLDVEDMIDS